MKFFAIAYIMQMFWRRACRGSFTAQLFYCLLVADALHSITHSTQRFFSPFVHIMIFVFPFLIYARVKQGRVSASPAIRRYGDGCVIGANTAVTKSLEPYSVAAGVTTKVIHKRGEAAK